MYQMFVIWLIKLPNPSNLIAGGFVIYNKAAD